MHSWYLTMTLITVCSRTPNQYGLHHNFGIWFEKWVSRRCVVMMSNNDCGSNHTHQTAEHSEMFSDLDGLINSLYLCQIWIISSLLRKVIFTLYFFTLYCQVENVWWFWLVTKLWENKYEVVLCTDMLSFSHLHT